jgi:hypothetical protein
LLCDAFEIDFGGARFDSLPVFVAIITYCVVVLLIPTSKLQEYISNQEIIDSSQTSNNFLFADTPYVKAV